MAEFMLPANSVVQKGQSHPAPVDAAELKTFEVYRFEPDAGDNPRLDTYQVDVDACGVAGPAFDEVNEGRLVDDRIGVRHDDNGGYPACRC